jgi:tripartite-type tricarboxylate transporter receptor subunit TctC
MAGPLKAGKLRALGLTAAKRNPAFPDVPTMAEAGIPGMEISLWTGIVAPINTPPEIVSLLARTIRQILVLDDVKKAMEAIAVEPRSTTPDEYRDLIARDTTRWKEVAAAANIKLE